MGMSGTVIAIITIIGVSAVAEGERLFWSIRGHRAWPSDSLLTVASG